MADQRSASTPVLIFTGFLGSGKTTLLNRAIDAAWPRRIGVIVNEFGAIGIDDALIEGAAGQVVELSNGCVCCAGYQDLARAIEYMSARSEDFDAIVLETSGLADPAQAIDLLVTRKGTNELTLSGVITTIDCENFDANLARATIAYQQMVSADLFVLTKTSTADAADVVRIPERLGRINRRAAVVRDEQATSAIDSLLTEPIPRPHARPTRPGPDRHGNQLLASTMTLPVPLDRVRFNAWATALGTDVVRGKGLVRFAGDPRPFAFDRVGARSTLRPAPQAAGDRLGEHGAILVLFGSDPDQTITQSTNYFSASPGESETYADRS